MGCCTSGFRNWVQNVNGLSFLVFFVLLLFFLLLLLLLISLKEEILDLLLGLNAKVIRGYQSYFKVTVVIAEALK